MASIPQCKRRTYSFSNEDISTMLAPFGGCPIIKYPELEDVTNVINLLKQYGFIVVLFMNGSLNYGHWCCLTLSPSSKMSNNKQSINFFDSYGIPPDSQKDYIDDNFLELSDQERNYLSEALYRLSDQYNIEYQEKQLQKKSKTNKTCGRHCICRIILKDYPLELYQKFMLTGKLTPDQKVTKITNMLMDRQCCIEDVEAMIQSTV
jgi:hypothetical protein